MIRSLTKPALLIAALTASITHAEPFTYQGQLNDNGAVADGIYDFRFDLFDAPAAGTQIGPTVVHENISVVDGVFTVELDFGPSVFQSTSRFLEIDLREGTTGGLFTTLTPRTQINPAPAAQHATTADTLTNPIWNQSGSVIDAGSGVDRVFINRTDPISAAEYFGVYGDVADFVGMYVAGPANSLPFYGYSVDGAISAYTYYNPINSAWTLVNNSTSILEVPADNDLHVFRDVHAESFQFETPKVNYLSIAGDSFHSGQGDPFIVSSGTGGGYLSVPGFGWLVAPVSLPHNATVIRMRAYFNDSAAGDLIINLNSRTHGGDIAFALASISTAGFFGSNQVATDNTIINAQIDNNQTHYHMRVVSTNWSGNITLAIKSIVIEYTTTQAD